MRNYIILNGKNSNEINGLLIQELPPISKPQIRTETEEIDGRDGDIVTKLGFAAYDKEISVGLYKDFDINEIIAYFNSEGTIVFSNEPDKYYNYQIIDQIDFERLVRYRTATIRMHCQPFKYSTTQGTITKDASATVSDEGSNLVLENTAEAPFNKLEPKGNASQQTYSGKNLLRIAPETHTSGGLTWTVTEDTITVSGTATGTTSNGAYFTPPTQLAPGQYRLAIPQAASYGIRMQHIEPDNTTDHITNIIPAGETYAADTTNWTTARIRISFFGWQNGDSINFSFPNRVMFSAGDAVEPYEPYVGGVPSPNPDYPQGVNVVSGAQTVKITGKNLAEMQDGDTTGSGITASRSSTTGEVILNGTSTSTATINASTLYTIPIVAGETYTISANNADANSSVSIRLNIRNVGSYQNFYLYDANQTKTFTSDYTGNCTLQVRVSSGKTFNNYIVKPQVERSASASQFEPYQAQSQIINLGSLELAKIGTYQDYIWNDGGTWKIHKAIGKVIFDGSEAWNIASNGNSFYRTMADATRMPDRNTNAYAVSNYYTAETYNRTTTATPVIDYGMSLSDTANRINIRNKDIVTVADWLTWLASHPTTVYYALATPVDEEITDATLIEQLEALAEAHSYKGRTYINATATGNNAPHIIAAEVGVDNESTVTNSGNINSKPVIKIYGSGNIGAYLNDIQILQIALGDEGYITIDTNLMEAYKDTLDNLKNRLVTGDYNKFSLKPGANKTHFSGTVTKYEISKYSRWL